MKRVLMVHPSVDLYGSDRIFLQAVRACKDTHLVTVALLSPGILPSIIQAEGAEVTFQQMAVLRRSSLRPFAFAVLLLASMRNLLSALILIHRLNPDVVYVSTTTIPVWLLAGRLSRKPTVNHVHEAEDRLSKILARCFYAPLLLAHLVVVNSRATAAAIGKALPKLASRSTLVYNGVASPSRPFSPNRDMPSDPLKLVLVGRLSANKGSDVAVDAVGLLRADGLDVRLRLIGDIFPGNERFREQLIGQCRRWNIGEHVEFAGFQDSPWPAYEDADIVLVPSRLESFGNVAVEAMLTGRPVIASDAQGLPEIVSDGETGFIVPLGDPQALADRIRQARDDWSTVVEVAARGQIWAKQAFGVATFGMALLDVLDRMTPVA
jgi:glycosyltransferase involved in cell wall biosynthesis